MTGPESGGAIPADVRSWARKNPRDPRAKLLRQMVKELRDAEIGLDDAYHPLALWYQEEVEELRASGLMTEPEPGLIWSVRKA